jgi:septal ring factor EnvC (AmiA/AmiB activator)
MQDQLFEGLSNPVQTQKREADDRFKALRNSIDGEQDAAAKRKLIANIVVPLAQTWGQRDELQRKIHDPNVSIDTLLAADGPFEAAFREAVEGKTAAGDQLAFEERRQALAHVLCNLGDTPEDHRRALAVVGIQAYVHEVDAQATALANMIPQIQHAMEADLAAFELEHKDLIRQIVTLAERIRHQDEILQRQTLLAQEHTTLVGLRKADVQRVNAEIDEAKKATDTALQGQSGLEDALFKAQRAIATAAETNRQLLRQIDALEHSAGGEKQP